MGDGCAGNGIGCKSGTGGAAAISGRAGATLAGALDLGTIAFNTMLDAVIVGGVCGGNSGIASDGGDGNG